MCYSTLPILAHKNGNTREARGLFIFSRRFNHTLQMWFLRERATPLMWPGSPSLRKGRECHADRVDISRRRVMVAQYLLLAIDFNGAVRDLHALPAWILLTLPGLKARGFLVPRAALLCCHC